MAIIVYSKANCPACVFTVRWLERCGLAYTVESVDAPAARALATERGFKAAPIVKAGSRAWCGLRPDELDRIRPADAEPEPVEQVEIDMKARTALIKVLWYYIQTLIIRQQRP